MKVKSTGKTKVKVSAKYFKSKKVKFKKKGTKTVKLKMTSKGSSKLSLCGAKTVKVTGKYGENEKAKKKLSKDSSRCIKVPLGADPRTVTSSIRPSACSRSPTTTSPRMPTLRRARS